MKVKLLDRKDGRRTYMVVLGSGEEATLIRDEG